MLIVLSSQVLLHPEFIEPRDQECLRSILSRLSKETSQYPQCYVLDGLRIDQLEPADNSGGFCDVYKVRYSEQEVCLRVLRLGQRSDVERVIKDYSVEAILWGELEHENILPLYGLFYLDTSLTRICLVSPWMENGNVVRYLEMNTTKPRKPLVCDIACGLEYLHGRDVVHGDLKGTNILVDNMGRACIADFGSSSFQMDMSLSLMTMTNSPAHRADRWAAPELSEDTPRPNKLTDIWSVGCVFFEVLTGLLPFSKYQSTRQINRVLDRGGLPDERNPDSIISSDEYDEGMRNLVHRCWASNPQYRPTSEGIVYDLRAQGLVGNGRDDDVQALLTREKEHFREVTRRDRNLSKPPAGVDGARVEQILGQKLIRAGSNSWLETSSQL
ncbi:kinase-like protein [Macrolepiota fuliginosa MF-IS2]|uniref:Kinase-like protein n=1 Tax=Macrolepiota fuliginosa MF-IS2 TaxID=1400762 RepID=A0A9P5XFD0_9AGAR|nr:kinase-like protein [Macrolepiota fuliginosa MF-IS2]